MYAGLRRGELKALRAGSVDLKANVIHVVRGWDDKEGEIETKGRNLRRVPIIPELRELLLAHLMHTGRRDDDLVFGLTASVPFDSRKLYTRAYAVWDAAGLKRISPQECRHTFASLMIAAGANAKTISTYMGPLVHSSHLRQVRPPDAGQRGPGGRAARRLLDARQGERRVTRLARPLARGPLEPLRKAESGRGTTSGGPRALKRNDRRWPVRDGR
jgi:hypothetical protein